MPTTNRLNLDEPILRILRMEKVPLDIELLGQRLSEQGQPVRRADLTEAIWRLVSDKLAELTPDRKVRAAS